MVKNSDGTLYGPFFDYDDDKALIKACTWAKKHEKELGEWFVEEVKSEI